MSRATELADEAGTLIRLHKSSGLGMDADAAAQLLERQATELRRLNRVNAELVEALKDLYFACPTSLECKDFHHSKAERHAFDQPCKPATDFLLSLAKARAALTSSTGEPK